MIVSKGWPTFALRSAIVHPDARGHSRTAQLRYPRKDASYEAFVILLLRASSRLSLAQGFIAGISAIGIDYGTIRRAGHEKEVEGEGELKAGIQGKDTAKRSIASNTPDPQLVQALRAVWGRILINLPLKNRSLTSLQGRI